MLTAAQHLSSLGHSVTFNTSERFRLKAQSNDIRFVPLMGKANLDNQVVRDSREPTAQSGDVSKISLLKQSFAETIPDQHLGIQRILDDTPVDLVVTDTMFFGSFPMLLGPRQSRPPVMTFGVNPMMLTSRDAGFISPPDRTPIGQRRILEENQRVRSTFQPVTDHINLMMHSCGAPSLPHFFLDCLYLLPDLFLQFTAEAFEFPRSDMPDSVRFAGPLLPRRAVDFVEPAWWTELDRSKPVVLVTQGTIANDDFDELIQPTLSGLAAEQVTVIAATGRGDTKAISAPDNVRVASFIPFDRILPKVDVFITNGGYGAVNHALSLGVPVVVAGDTEDKDYVAARVGWSGAGINLKTRHPRPEQIRTAVRAILTNGQYNNEARRLQASFALYDTKNEIASAVAAMLTQESPAALLSIP